MTAHVNDPDYLYARQFALDVLRRLLMEEPSIPLLTYLRDEGLRLFPCADQQPVMEQACLKMQEDLNSYVLEDGSDDFENLHWDFTRLFIGPESPPAPAWESVYVSKDKLLFQQNTRAVKQFYQQHGFEMPGKEMEAADHIGYQLDFLWHLSHRAAQQLDNDGEITQQVCGSLETSHQFMHAHLLNFITPFCRNVHNHAQTEFYRSASALLEAFIRHDDDVIFAMVKLSR